MNAVFLGTTIKNVCWIPEDAPWLRTCPIGYFKLKSNPTQLEENFDANIEIWL